MGPEALLAIDEICGIKVSWAGLPIALAALILKLALAGAGLALLETVSAKMRIFRAPEFLGTAFMLATLGMLTHFLLER